MNCNETEDFRGKSSNDGGQKSTKPFVIKEVPGKGKGLVSSSLINPGDLILTDRMLIGLNPADISDQNIRTALKSLPKRNQKKFNSLFGGQSQDLKKIFLLNGIQMDDDQSAVFPTLSYINHSCAPNAVWGSLEDPGLLELRAVSCINPGQEITVNYIEDQVFLLNAQQRNRILRDVWEFSCSCKECLDESETGIINLLKQISSRSKKCICEDDYNTAYRLQKHKLKVVLGNRRNQPELINTFEVLIVLSSVAKVEKEEILLLLADWRDKCWNISECLKSYEGLNRSFCNGSPVHIQEFAQQNDPNLRDEWKRWIYKKL